MNNKGVEFVGKMPDGREVRFYKDEHFWRGFLAPGKPIGEPYVKLNSLLASLGAIINAGQDMPGTAAAAIESGEVKVEVTCKAIGADGIGYEIRHDGYHYRAFLDNANPKALPVAEPYMLKERLLKQLNATLAPVEPEAPAGELEAPAGELEAPAAETAAQELHPPDPSCPMPGNQCAAPKAEPEAEEKKEAGGRDKSVHRDKKK